MNEFDPMQAEKAPLLPPTPPPEKQSLLTRPLFMGQSLPWLAGIALFITAGVWYLFLRGPDTPEAAQLVFGQEYSFGAVQPDPAVSSSPSVSAPTRLQTGGLSVPAATLNGTGAPDSVPDDVVKLIREGREFEAANREAITRLSDTVRAQTKALAMLQQQLDGVTSESVRLADQLTVLAARQVPTVTGHRTTGRKAPRSAFAGMRLESLQDGMAWVSWQGRTWAVQPGDSLGGVTMRDVNLSERSVTTSAGVLR